MRLKTVDGSFSLHNGNDPDILNSPKRINTIQNSNITSSNLAVNNINSNDITTTQTADITTLNNVNTEDTVQWCNRALTQVRELTNNAKNRTQFNINNTLAASLRGSRYGTASSLCSESSPDDSLLDYEEAHQSSSSIDASPQDEDRGFDISDSESLSDEGNLNTRETLQRRGIVNPNYPGFQHLAHTLEYTIKTSSDTDFTDDDFEYDSSTVKLNAEENSINNNNDETVEYKIDSVNRLDSVENIQKVFYDKPAFNIPLPPNNLKRNNCESEEASGFNSNSNQGSDDDFDVATPQKILCNIHSDKISIDKSKDLESCVTVNDFARKSNDVSQNLTYNKPEIDSETYDELGDRSSNCQIDFALERTIENELKEAIEKLTTSTNLEPSAISYNIEPNTDQPFNKTCKSQIESVDLQEPTTITQTVSMAAMSCIHNPSSNTNMNHFPNSGGFNENTKSTIPDTESLDYVKDAYKHKISDAFLSEVGEDITDVLQIASNFFTEADLNANSEQLSETDMDVEIYEKNKIKSKRDSNREVEEYEEIARNKRINEPHQKLDERKSDEMEKFCKEDQTKDDKEKDEDTVIPRKKEKIETTHVKKRRDYNQQFGSLITVPRREFSGKSRDVLNRRSMPTIRDKKKQSPEILGGFDVYNIETAMPKIDLDAIESHLRAAREEERRRRTDREEIRRRLAMGAEDDYYNDRPGRKPSLQARLQSGMNLQICFMNETASDTDSPSSDSECPMTNPKEQRMSPKVNKTTVSQPEIVAPIPPIRPVTLSIGQPLLQPVTEHMAKTDFFTRQARLQTEARMALAQAKEMARMQMEIERQRQVKSPITEMVRHSLEKVGIPFPEERRRLSRQILTEMNVAQLQVIVNDLHTQIETLNEVLVKFLMERDDLHMEQDSMLVDIEDLTRYLGAKEQKLKEQTVTPQNNNLTPLTTTLSSPPRSPLAALNSSVKPHLHRIANFVKK